MSNLEIKYIPLDIKQETINISCLHRPGIKKPVLFLHGLGSTKYDFIGAFHSGILENHELLSFDFPGSGGSDYPNSSFLTMSDLVQITWEVIDYFNLQGISLAGHSMGGLTALLLATHYPTAFSNFINIEGNITPEDCGIFSRKTAELDIDEYWRTSHFTTIREPFLELNNPGAQIFADRFSSAIQPKAFYDYCSSIVTWSDNGGLMDIFLSLDMPRLFLCGGKNNLSYLPELNGAGITVSEYKDSHHWPHLDCPDIFFKDVVSFNTNSKTEPKRNK